MTTKDIVEIVVSNHMECQVYNALHSIIMSNIGYLSEVNTKLSSERKLVKKFADANKLDVVKTILSDEVSDI